MKIFAIYYYHPEYWRVSVLETCWEPRVKELELRLAKEGQKVKCKTDVQDPRGMLNMGMMIAGAADSARDIEKLNKALDQVIEFDKKMGK